ncbi:YceI family protein [Mucilaginibacter sp. RS28]|uniref:YceI family protein n=1 Tax=Mucilaginibacter straminoryzae TaxID=2932774 RepID=A0A9X2BCJ9_9SPHI|nr:YceI family protein [Mucilaginibacter straminoryzae]MCJ8210992.1 YceI family protein [Mucilaginibacter straminoryzae]
MKHIAFILLAWMHIFQTGQGTFVSKNAKISLFSKAPLEDIDATSTKGTSVFNAQTGDLAFSVPIHSFQFEKSLMQEHFNENYMESDKYPNATFKGKVQENVDVTKDGSYPITVAGTLVVHGVKQNRTIKGNLMVKNGAVTMTAEFVVMCKDHNIDIPKLVFQKIAESIQVKVEANYNAYKK